MAKPRLVVWIFSGQSTVAPLRSSLVLDSFRLILYIKVPFGQPSSSKQLIAGVKVSINKAEIYTYAFF